MEDVGEDLMDVQTGMNGHVKQSVTSTVMNDVRQTSEIEEYSNGEIRT